MQATGASALGIVGLVTGLVGLIIAFIGAVQLQVFGAQIYVASLVGIAMVRDLGAVMAAIVVAGRTGAAYAAELGTMRSSQELDAYATLGISPYDFLVLPRVLAVTLMMPVLCVYADALGVAGGALVAIGPMHISPRLYVDQTIRAVTVGHLFGGIMKATTYGLLVGMAGCFIGLRAERSAAGVGRAATSAVVAGIVLVIAACGTFAVLFYRLGW
jgi:phospholipid/cholesterol/gamma-HCH transport system permease protein